MSDEDILKTQASRAIRSNKIQDLHITWYGKLKKNLTNLELNVL